MHLLPFGLDQLQRLLQHMRRPHCGCCRGAGKAQVTLLEGGAGAEGCAAGLVPLVSQRLGLKTCAHILGVTHLPRGEKCIGLLRSFQGICVGLGGGSVDSLADTV